MTEFEFTIPVQYTIKVHALSTDLPKDELRELVNVKVHEDLARDARLLNGYSGGHTDGHKAYAYSYEAVSLEKDCNGA